MAELRLDTERRDGRVILAPGAWVDISNVGTLLDAVRDAASESGVEAVGVDFVGTEYIDSATISTLIQAQKLCEDAGKLFGLVRLHDQVRRVLTETRLIDIFQVYPDREAFRAGPPPPRGA